MKLQLAHQSCFDCSKEWIQFLPRTTCPVCNSPVMSAPVYVSHVRRAMEVLQDELHNQDIDATTATARSQLLRDSYFRVAPVATARISQIYQLAMQDMASDKVTEDVLSRLYLVAYGLMELGLGTASLGALAMLMASLAVRHYRLDGIQRSDDSTWLQRMLDAPGITQNPLYFKLLLRICDLTRAVEWARFLHLEGWEVLMFTLAGVCTARDSRLLAGSESLPFRAVALHHLSQAVAISRQNNYFYLLPWLEKLQTELYANTRQLDDSQDPYQLGQQLQDRLAGHWLLSGQREALQAVPDSPSGALNRISWMGTGALVGLRDLDLPSLQRELAVVVDGTDRHYLQEIMDHPWDQSITFNIHLAPLNALVSHHLDRYSRWLEVARQPYFKARDVHQVMISGLQDDARAMAD